MGILFARTVCMRDRLGLFSIALACACTRAVHVASGSVALDPSPPWEGAPLSASALPSTYATEWQKAANRERCRLIAPASLGNRENATARAGKFGGGWAVVYDQGGLK